MKSFKLHLGTILITTLIMSACTNSSIELPYDWALYSSDSLTFNYPKILALTETKNGVALKHSIPDEHDDPCNMKGNTLLHEFTDFDLTLDLIDLSLVETARQEVKIFEEDIQGDTLIETKGWIDSIKIGTFEGFQITSSSEYCGGNYYLFSISKNQTALIYRKLITEWTFEPTEKYSSNPDVITQNEEALYFEQIIKSLKVK